MFPNWVLCHWQRIWELDFFLIPKRTCGRRFVWRGTEKWPPHCKVLLEIPFLSHTLVNLDCYTWIMPNSLEPDGNIWLLEVFLYSLGFWMTETCTNNTSCFVEQCVVPLSAEREYVYTRNRHDLELMSLCMWVVGKWGVIVLSPDLGTIHAFSSY